MPEDKVANKLLTFDQEVKRSMLQCIGNFYQEIDIHCKRMECISNQFKILKPTYLIEALETELTKFVQSLVDS